LIKKNYQFIPPATKQDLCPSLQLFTLKELYRDSIHVELGANQQQQGMAKVKKHPYFAGCEVIVTRPK